MCHGCTVSCSCAVRLFLLILISAGAAVSGAEVLVSVWDVRAVTVPASNAGHPAPSTMTGMIMQDRLA